MTAPKRVCVDLDHVLASPDGPRIGLPYLGAKFFLQMLRTSGVEIVIHTARIDPVVPSRSQVNMVRSWLDQHDLPYDWVCGKPEAIAYVDDRAVAMSACPSSSDYDTAIREIVRLHDGQREAS